jgi:hypothetical protein
LKGLTCKSPVCIFPAESATKHDASVAIWHPLPWSPHHQLASTDKKPKKALKHIKTIHHAEEVQVAQIVPPDCNLRRTLMA